MKGSMNISMWLVHGFRKTYTFSLIFWILIKFIKGMSNLCISYKLGTMLFNLVKHNVE